jgi:ferredoxin
MKVWIDIDECMGAGTCEQIARLVFVDGGDGVWLVKEDGRFFGETRVMGPGEPARVPDALIGDVIEAAEECPAGCIFVEP